MRDVCQIAVLTVLYWMGMGVGYYLAISNHARRTKDMRQKMDKVRDSLFFNRFYFNQTNTHQLWRGN